MSLLLGLRDCMLTRAALSLQSNFSITESIFNGTQALPIQLIWLHLVYGKMFSQARHLVFMFSEEKIFFIILSLFFGCLYIFFVILPNFVGGRCYCQCLLLCQMLRHHFCVPLKIDSVIEKLDPRI